jgi:uracil-DNA glycosylase
MHPSWNDLFASYAFDLDMICEGTVFPPRDHIFRVFTMPVEEIRLVFLGQDPYHGRGQAHGLAFSVERGVPIPPSLRNIFRELQTDFPERSYTFSHGSLEAWHSRGIFLLNTALTVEEGKANSHSHIWQEFTDDVIRYIATRNKHCVFLLLGNNAKSKASFLSEEDTKRVVMGVHPSPLSAHRGFFGSNLFKQVEEKLGAPLDWRISLEPE